MSVLDTSGRLLEGIRVSVGNNPYTFPARSFVSNNSAFQAVDSRAEYAIIVGSLNRNDKEMGIADPNLIFYYTKNESTAIRFDYDSFGRRFSPAPGGSPNELGPIGNDSRLSMPVPDLALTDAPFDIYIGDTTRTLVFNLTTVPTDGDFSNPITMTAGDVEISEESGSLNFSQNDVDTYDNQIVLATRQSFSDRTQASGSFGQLPVSSSIDYFLFLNPRPASGQYPLIRIGYQRHLQAIEVATESLLGSPISGTCHWSADTGRVRFSSTDVSQNLQQTVYYDGLFLGAKQLTSITVGYALNAYPSAAFFIPEAIGETNAARFIISAELNGVRHYFPIALINVGFPVNPPAGIAYVDTTTGAVFLSFFSIIVYFGWTFSYTDTYLEIEDGVSVQLYRSGVNGSGAPAAPDFTITYAVEEQRITGKIGQSPVVFLPTVPVVDNDLKYTINQVVGSVGTFTGDLVDGTDPDKAGIGYLLDLNQRMLKFSTRKTMSSLLLKPVSTVKLEDAALSQFGFESTKNGSQQTPGIDFDLDYDTGLVDFVQPIGENDPNNVLGIIGTVSLYGSIFPVAKAFTADESVFVSGHVGNYLLVNSGENVGIYKITKYINPKKVLVSPNFKQTGSTTVDLRIGVEIIADRFWAPFLPPYKKFSLSKAASANDEYIEIENTDFNVFKNTGQVNIDHPAFPGEHYQISYVSLETAEDGVTQTPTNRVEKALFRIRQEKATIETSGSSTPEASPSADRTAFLEALADVPPEERTCDAPVAGPLQISTAVAKTLNIKDSLKQSENENQAVASGKFRVGFVFGAESGSRTALFNPDGNTVSTERPIEVFVNGIPLEEGDFIFEAPGTLKFTTPIGEDQLVILNYWIEEATGSNTSFDLLHSPIDLDTPEIVADEKTATFNGNQTSLLSAGSAILIDEKEIIIVDSAVYDSSNDVTNVEFEVAPTISSDGAPLMATGSITGSYRLSETNAVDVFSQGSNTLNIAGDRSFCYVNGTVITVDGDPYLVISSEYDQNNNQTTVSVAGSAKRNYIIPSVTRTIRPVLSSTGSFLTKLEAHSDFPFTLVKMGTDREILIQNVDYTVADGGMVSLSTDIQFGDSLYAMYVARERQPIGTSFTFNYSYAIAPNETNGLLGQELVATYNLYAPDSFFYRAETVETFLPEVSSLLESGSQTSSGPNIDDAATATNTKDSGSESPYFQEYHQENLDIAIARLLLYYNDLINLYEDLLSNLDGRIVGGNYGRFRFDGNFNNPYRSGYASITNDIDDQAKLYDQFVLTGFFSFDFVPVYGRVGQPNKLSRLFPTVKVATAAINDQTSFFDFGNDLGSLGVSNIRSAGMLSSSRGRSLFDTINATGTTYTIEKNGDPDNLIPQFEVGQQVGVYNLNGALDTTALVLAATTSEPATIVLDTATALKEGSLLRTIGDPDNTVHYYSPGRDLLVNLENGQIVNFTLPQPLHGIFQNDVSGNEILDCFVEFSNNDIAPARIPVLDGEELNDDGKIPAPIIKRVGESNLLDKELNALTRFGNAIVNPDKITIVNSSITVTVGQTIKFIDGPNAGISRIVLTVIGPTSFTVSIPFLVADAIGSNFTASNVTGDDLITILNQEIGILNTNTKSLPVSPVQVGRLDSEFITIYNIILSFGEIQTTGSGNAVGVTLNDPSANFTADGVDNQSLLYVPSGNNRGLYKLTDVTANQLTVDDTSPFTAFPTVGTTPYTIIDKSGLISDAHTEFVTEFLRETIDFYNNTSSFLSNPTAAGKTARSTKVNARISQIDEFIGQIEGILDGEQLYNIRYLWIDQRVNRKEGTFVKKVIAAQKRQEDIQKIINDQTKLLVLSKM